MKIVFFGDTDFSQPSIKKLIEFDYDLTVIEKKDGSLKDEKFFEYFKSLNPDICIVADYGRIIPSRYLDIPKYKFLNIHPSLLPKYRGPSPIQSAILNGDTETGVTIMVVDVEVDHGPILTQKTYNLQPTTYYAEVEEALGKLGAAPLIEILPKYLSGEVKPKEQDHSQATFTKMFTRADARIDWNQSGEKIYNQIRALNPEPGTWTMWKDKILNIREIGIRNYELRITNSDLGKIVKLDKDIAIATKTCYLILKKIQLEGRKEMDAKSFVNGHPDFIGSILE